MNAKTISGTTRFDPKLPTGCLYKKAEVSWECLFLANISKNMFEVLTLLNTTVWDRSLQDALSIKHLRVHGKLLGNLGDEFPDTFFLPKDCVTAVFDKIYVSMNISIQSSTESIEVKRGFDYSSFMRIKCSGNPLNLKNLVFEGGIIGISVEKLHLMNHYCNFVCDHLCIYTAPDSVIQEHYHIKLGYVSGMIDVSLNSYHITIESFSVLKIQSESYSNIKVIKRTNSDI